MEGRAPYRKPAGAPREPRQEPQNSEQRVGWGKDEYKYQSLMQAITAKDLPVTITYLDGTAVTGKIEREDRYNMVLMGSDGIHIVYKHAIKELVIKKK